MTQKSTGVILVLSDNSELVSEIRGYLAEVTYKIVEGSHRAPLTEALLTQDAVRVVLCDLVVDESEIAASIHLLKAQAPRIPFIGLIDEGHVRSAVMIMQHGARTVLTKPIDRDSLLLALDDIGSQAVPPPQTQTIIQQAIQLLQSLSHVSEAANEPPVNASQLTSTAVPDVIHLNDLRIDLIRQKAFYREMVIDLTASQFRLLSCLAESNKHIVSYEDLYFCLHNIHLDRASARKALSAHLSYLRTKLSEAGCEAYLVNVRGRGYLLDIPTEEIDQPDEISLDLILEQLPIILWTTNLQLRLTSALGAEHLYLDRSSNNYIGSRLEDFLQLSASDPILSAHQQALVGETSQHKRLLCDRPFHISIQPYRDHKDNIIGCIGIALSIADHV